jgi:hypothetical protein
MSDPLFKYTNAMQTSVVRIWPDGRCESHLVSAQVVRDWVAAGNTVEPCDPPPPPIDYSSADNIDKTLRAILYAASIMAGKTPAQARAAFKTAWDALP